MKKLQTVQTHWHVYMTINIDFKKKGTCDMAKHAYKIHNVEKMFRTYTKVNVQKKSISKLHQEHTSP